MSANVKKILEDVKANKAKEAHFDDMGINDSMMAEIAQTCVASTSLEQLSLAGNEIGSAGIKILVTALASTPSKIKAINLEQNKGGDEGLMIFASFLAENKSLQGLNFGKNGVTDKGAIAVATALIGNSSLQELGLDDNPGITEKSAHALKAMLQGSRLSWIGVEGTSIPLLSQEDIETFTEVPPEKRSIPTSADAIAAIKSKIAA